MDDGKKNTPNVLTTNEIRENARNWTLAGDVGLLAHLEQFSESIISKTQETQKNFNQLVDDYEELHTKVGNITNQFLALQNCQFVENRVYDEETPIEEKTEVKVQDEVDQEKLLLMQYKEVVEVGIKLLDTHFQEVQLPPNSDSDEEDEVSPGNSVIWKPKNLYTNKKFPFLIGSADWWADDNVGLKPNKDILDIDKVISESESESESLKSIEKPTKLSSSSSMENVKSIPTKPPFLESTEDLFGFDKNENVRNATSDDLSKGSNSLSEEPANFLPDFDKKSEPELNKRENSVGETKSQTEENPNEEETKKPKKVDGEFTRELMAKLVSVTNTTLKESEKKEKIEESLPPRKTYNEENLFDETDDSSDLFSTKTNKVTEKSEGRKGLFFDEENEDDLFRGENDLFSGGSLFESEVFKKSDGQSVQKNDLESRREPKNTMKKEEETAPKKSLVNDLFGDLDDDDTLFSVKTSTQKEIEKSLSRGNESINKSKTGGLSWGNGEGLFDDMNNEIEDDFFNSSGLFEPKLKKSEDVHTSDRETNSKESNSLPKEPEMVKSKNLKPETSDSDLKAVKTEDTFDDPFGFSSSKDSKKMSILEPEDEDDLFSKKFTQEKKSSVKILPEDDEDSALFAEKPKPPDSVSVSSSRSSLFDDVTASKSRLASVFEKDKPSKVENEFYNTTNDSLFSGDEKPGKDLFTRKTKEERSSLFDDCDDSDDLFGGGGGGGSEKLAEKPENIFQKEKDTVKKDDLEENDLFQTSKTNVRGAKSEIFKRSEQNLFADESSDLFSEKQTTSKPKPPNSLSLKGAEPETKSQNVGKLNIPDNLKAKFETVAKHISPGGMKPVEGRKEEKKEDTLEESIQPSALLKCPSKDRVKIPGRRRPQSRRARQEAIRNSGTWDQPSNQQPKDSLPSPVASNPLSPSTDEEDFFKVPELDTNFEKEDQSIFKSDLFESTTNSKMDDSLLFDGAPVLSPLSPKQTGEKHEVLASKSDSLFGEIKPKASSIFDDGELNEEDDENLFKSPKPGSRVQKVEEKVKKPLFDPDLDDEDDDLFGGISQVTPKLLAVNKPKDEGERRKEKENSSFVDPLGLMTGNQ